MAVMDGARPPAFMRRLPRTSKQLSTPPSLSLPDLCPTGGTLHQTVNRLPSILLALDSRGTQRRIPVRRGRMSAPMATVPRRWAPRAAHHAHLQLP
jgi:hypothetical protein